MEEEPPFATMHATQVMTRVYLAVEVGGGRGYMDQA